MSKRLIPLAAMEKIIRNAGAVRVSDDAKIELKKIIEDKAQRISSRAACFAKHAGRKTIKADDVRLAIKEIR